MPELPEVETIRRQLAPLVEGRRVLRVEIGDPRWSRPLAPEELADALVGRRVERLDRRGKYLVWCLDREVYLVQHLRMTGAILCDPRPEPAHVRVRMELGALRGGASAARGTTDAARGGASAARGTTDVVRGQPSAQPNAGVQPRRVRLAMTDPRRFGTGELVLGEAALERFFAARLGPEPFDERFTPRWLRAAVRGRAAPIKAWLLDQRRVAGVGNIYADEALFRAGIHPLRPAGALSTAQCTRLRDAVVEVLHEGIDARGASIEDFRHVDGVRGSFQDRFLVHRRAGLPCPRCGRTIVKILAAGRGTYVCERCQPRPRGVRQGRLSLRPPQARRPAAPPDDRSGRPPASR